eukprot:6196327-Pleurochrysis_carterae.AAC.1
MRSGRKKRSRGAVIGASDAELPHFGFKARIGSLLGLAKCTVAVLGIWRERAYRVPTWPARARPCLGGPRAGRRWGPRL